MTLPMPESRTEWSYPSISEQKMISITTIMIALFTGVLFVCFLFLALLRFNLSLIASLTLACGLAGAYVVILPGLLTATRVREIRTHGITTIEKPIVRDVVHVVEKRVPQQLVELRAPVLQTAPRVRFSFIGSIETKRFHKRGCRLSRLIKAKYKILRNSPAYFQTKRFKRCKVCLR